MQETITTEEIIEPVELREYPDIIPVEIKKEDIPAGSPEETIDTDIGNVDEGIIS